MEKDQSFLIELRTCEIKLRDAKSRICENLSLLCDQEPKNI